MKSYYHYCSKGLTLDVLFANTAEFIAGMNRVAICVLLAVARGMPVQVISFCLMDNHVHFILYGSREACDLFAADFKKLTGMWITRHRGERLHDNIDFGEGFVIRGRDDLREKIAYVLRNPVAAGMETTAQGYRWSTANLMFSDTTAVLSSGLKASSFSERKLREILGSKVPIPQDWIILSDGLIWPGCYTRQDAAVRQFDSARNFTFMLGDSRIDGRVNEEMASQTLSIPDGEIRGHARALAKELFGAGSIGDCDPNQRLTVCRILRKTYKCGTKQLARITGLKQETISDLI